MAKDGINLPFKVLCCFVFTFVNMQEEKKCVLIPPLTKVYIHIHNITLPGNRHVI